MSETDRRDAAPLSRRRLIGGAFVAGAAAPLAAPALAQGRLRWRMATSWPKNLPGPGVSAQRLADRIGALSGGQLTVELFAAGELMSFQGVFDAVASDAIEMAHTASVFWSGKARAAPIFTAAPFGLTPTEHGSWIEFGGGQALWDQLYEPYGLIGFLAGNTGPSFGGWFREEIFSLNDLKGLRMRMAGLGAEMFGRLGVAAVAIAPGEIYESLRSGVVDAAEFASPFADAALGLEQAARFVYYPALHEPNGASEALVARARFEALPADLQAVLRAACREEHGLGLAEAGRANAAALHQLTALRGAQLRPWPNDVVRAAKRAAQATLADVAEAGAANRRVVEGLLDALALSLPTARVAAAPFLAAREA